MRTQALFITLLTIITLLFGSNQVFAVEIPNFPSCLNPQGTIKVAYNEGAHGIIGDTRQYTGKDTVYQLDNGNLTQCFCSIDGQGIQTNWWKDGSINAQERQILINSGWKYIPNGALWGLEEAFYFAKNANYSCSDGNGGGGSSGGSGGPGDGRSDGLGCANHDCSGQAGRGGQTLGVSTTSIGEVLGLATTGGSFIPAVLAILGVLSLVSGLYLRKKALGK